MRFIFHCRSAIDQSAVTSAADDEPTDNAPDLSTNTVDPFYAHQGGTGMKAFVRPKYSNDPNWNYFGRSTKDETNLNDPSQRARSRSLHELSPESDLERALSPNAHAG